MNTVPGNTKMNWRKVLFWLIVIIALWLLMAVIAPGRIITSRVVANESSAEGALKLLASTEGTWKQTDADGNGIKDYWTLDVSCIHRLYRENGTTKVAMIDMAIARSDVNAYSRDNPSSFDLGNGNKRDIEDWGSTAALSAIFTTTAKSGYFYRAMLLDEDGIPYNQNPVGKNQIKACNTNKFAFVAYPQVYGTSGTYTWIINEKGILYGTDCGSDDKKVILQWPAEPPISVIGPGGKPWRTADEIWDEWKKSDRIRQIKEGYVTLVILIIPLALIFIAIYNFFNALGMSWSGKIPIRWFIVIELSLIAVCGCIIIFSPMAFAGVDYIIDIIISTLLLATLINIPLGFIVKLLIYIFRE